MNESDFKCVRKPIRRLLSLTHHANKSRRLAEKICDDDTVIEAFFSLRTIINIFNFTWWMIGPLLWLIYWLGYFNTERPLLGSKTTVRCQWFRVNMGFSDKDRILMENLYIFKGCETKKNLVRNFWIKVGEWGLNKVFKNELQKTGMTARWSGSIKSIQNLSCFSIL